ncbi:MAG TPA: TonB family protein [Gemmatimonadaceae bacterium]|nr:TonB family protein [Gemmatimonadaceae bacterium]
MRDLSRSLRRLVPAALCAASLAATPVAAQTGVIAGTVRDEEGAGVAGAELQTVAGSIQAQANDRGEFRIPGVPTGAQRVVVRRLGFLPDTSIVQVPADAVVTLDVRLRRMTQALEAVEVRGARRVRHTGPHADFYDRAERGLGGRFITRDMLERRNPMLLTDMFRQLPGVRVEPTSTVRNAVRVRNARCWPQVIMDGARVASTGEPFDFDAVRASDVEGIEVYPSSMGLPPQFDGPGSDCGTIIVWTRRGGGPARQERSTEEVAQELASAVESLHIYTADQVDQPVQADPDAPVVPAYPDSLARQGVTGHVLMEFVVGVEGRPEIRSLKVLSATDRRLAILAIVAVRGARFVPARKDGKVVRQVVQLPFVFDLRPPSADSTRAATP